jgi:hypothetical protein
MGHLENLFADNAGLGVFFVQPLTARLIYDECWQVEVDPVACPHCPTASHTELGSPTITLKAR